MDAGQKRYAPDRLPTFFAGQAFDAALVIAAVLRSAKGDLTDTEKFRQAMLKPEFQAKRGASKFDRSHPVQGLRPSV